MSTTNSCTKIVCENVNRLFGKREPWQVATITATAVLSTIWLWNFINQDESVYSRSKKKVFKLLKKIPAVKRKIDEELTKANDGFEKTIKTACANLDYVLELPEKGLDNDDILLLVDAHVNLGNYNWRAGHVSGAVYSYNSDIVELVTKVYGKASYTNPLHIDVFPGICKMEAEVVRMACKLFNGDTNSCGTMTTGGTESILMACKAYRDYARETKGITKPNLIAPRTAHSAFDKAAQYFNIHINYIDIDPKTTQVNMKAFKRAINRNTIMLVGSAPNFPYGTMDDIEAIAALGVKYNIPVHVDACLGSFLIAMMREAGYNVDPFDFSVKGVTSISADTHKYGFAPKGSSIILYSHKKYRNHQFTVTTDWPGGVYGSPTVNGSRAGGIIAACWATMLSYGHEGYLETSKRILDTARYVESGLRGFPEIFVFGKPTTSVIAIGSKVFDIFSLSDRLCKLGWNLNALQFPSGIHFCITDMHTTNGVAQKFLSDVKTSIHEIMKDPTKPLEGKMAIYGMAQAVPDRSVIGEVTRLYLDNLYYTPALEK